MMKVWGTVLVAKAKPHEILDVIPYLDLNLIALLFVKVLPEITLHWHGKSQNRSNRIIWACMESVYIQFIWYRKYSSRISHDGSIPCIYKTKTLKDFAVQQKYPGQDIDYLVADFSLLQNASLSKWEGELACGHMLSYDINDPKTFPLYFLKTVKNCLIMIWGKLMLTNISTC